MKNKQTNVGSFATAKLQAISHRLIAIVALAALIGFSMVACEDGVGGPGGSGGGGGTGGNTPSGTTDTVTIPGLPSAKRYSFFVFVPGTDYYTRPAFNIAEGYGSGSDMLLSRGECHPPSNVFLLSRWRGSGTFPVALYIRNDDGDNYYSSTANFSNGNATVPFSSFTYMFTVNDT